MKSIHSKQFKVGILGGGQLGRMLLQESPNLGIDLWTMDSSEESPCAFISNRFVKGDITNYDDVIAFGEDKDILSIEIENVNIEALEELQNRGKKIFPQPNVIRTIQDKGLQKEFYKKYNIPSSDFILVNNKAELIQNTNFLPVAQKLRKGGYDGKGVEILKNEADLSKAFDAPCVLEKLVNIKKELSVIVARNEKGECKSFPLVELEFNSEANLVEFLFAPADVSVEIEEKAENLAMEIIQRLDMVGILAVELFLDENDAILVNEIAPRPHNSGHQSIEGNYTSQFGQHLRAILNLPLGDTKRRGSSVMINLLGEKGFEGPVFYQGLEEVLAIDGVYPHIYGKTSTKPFRKMGHVTILRKNLDEAKKIAKKVQETLKVISAS